MGPLFAVSSSSSWSISGPAAVGGGRVRVSIRFLRPADGALHTLDWGCGWGARPQWLMLPGWPFRTRGSRKDLAGRERLG